jgi:hypothetical protein
MLSSSFQNVELPCDWTVNRRPTQQQPTVEAPAGKGRGDHSKSKKAAGTKRLAESSGKKGHSSHNNSKSTSNTTSLMMVSTEREKEGFCGAASSSTEKEIIAEHIEAHPLGPLSSSTLSSSNKQAILIVSLPPEGLDNNHNINSKKRVRHLVLKHLSQREEPSVQSNGLESADTIVIDTEGLLSRLPYKKMLSDMFGGNLRGNMQNPTIPYVTRAYEEAFMREPMHANERECARGKKCECMFIDRGQAFVGVEFLLPGESVPRTPHLCVLCCRATTQQLYHDVMFDRVEFPGCIQRFGNIHSEPGEYSLDAMLIAVHTAPVHVMPLPIVSHQRNRYSVYVTGGIKHLKQSRVHFHFTPSCSAESGI